MRIKRGFSEDAPWCEFLTHFRGVEVKGQHWIVVGETPKLMTRLVNITGFTAREVENAARRIVISFATPIDGEREYVCNAEESDGYFVWLAMCALEAAGVPEDQIKKMIVTMFTEDKKNAQ